MVADDDTGEGLDNIFRDGASVCFLLGSVTVFISFVAEIGVMERKAVGEFDLFFAEGEALIVLLRLYGLGDHAGTFGLFLHEMDHVI